MGTKRNRIVVADPLILHIETATDICSVALSEGENLLALRESGAERNHATLLNRFIRECVEEAGRELKDLNAVAVSKGPGSYTGLRIGVSTAKGLAYALQVPLLSCLTLENMAHAAMTLENYGSLAGQYGPEILLCPMLDARRMEVYSAIYTPSFKLVRQVSAEIIDQNSFKDFLDRGPLIFFGNGSPKCKEVIQHPGALFMEGVQPSAAAMTGPVLEKYRASEFEDVAYFEPFYLKDFVATIPRKKVL